MAVYSEVDIYNLALLRLGADLLISPDEDNKQGRACRASYPYARDYLMSNYNWTFARATVEINAKDIEHPVYKYVYKKPNDCLAPMYLSERREGDVWELEGEYIITDVDTSWLWYVRRIEDVSKFSPAFVQAVSAFVCADIATAIVQDRDFALSKIQEAYRVITEAYRDDAMVGRFYRKWDEMPENDAFVHPGLNPLQSYFGVDAEPAT